MYLLINFDKNKNQDKETMFGTLESQYDRLKRQIINKGINISAIVYDSFFEHCIKGVNRFYISMPSVDERKLNSSRGWNYLNNCFIRIGKRASHVGLIPEDMDIIFRGDICIGENRKYFEVTGVELLDCNVAKYGEMPVDAEFSKDNGNGRLKPEFELLTDDFIKRVCESTRPVADLNSVINELNNCEKEIKFRREHIKQSLRKKIKFDTAKICSAYTVKYSDYKKDDTLSDKLLDGFRISEDSDVLLKDNLGGGEESKLLQIVIECYKHEVEQDLVNSKGKKHQTKFEYDLRKLVSSPIVLVHSDENNKTNDKNYKVFLEERYPIYKNIIDADYSKIEQNYADEFNEAHKKLEQEYKRKLEVRVDEFRDAKDNMYRTKFENDLKNFQEDKRRIINEEFQTNADKDISTKYEKELVKIEQRIKSTEGKLRKELEQHKVELEHQLKIRSEEANPNDKQNSKKGNKLSGMTTEQINELVSKIDEALASFEESTNKKIKVEQQKTSLRSYYDDKLKNIIDLFKSEQEKCIKEKVEKLVLTFRHQEQVNLQKIYEDKKNILNKELIKKRDLAIEEDKRKNTKIHFYIYYKVLEGMNIDKERMEKDKLNTIMSDTRAEEAKIKRKEYALKDIRAGKVRNPYLLSYLFQQDLKESAVYKPITLKWNLKSLNERQREAVEKAIANDGIFLLQGPPGTGKTQVIAELVSQLTIEGKKVLVASETHKAIDNVLDRLPKKPDIRPVRLMRHRGTSTSEYDVDKLYDNFCNNISKNIETKIKNINDFDEHEEMLRSKISKLSARYKEVENCKLNYDKLIKEKEHVNKAIEKQEQLKNKHYKAIKKLEKDNAIINESIRLIMEFDTSTEDAKIVRFISEIKKILKKYTSFRSTTDIETIAKVDLADIKVSLQVMTGEDPEVRKFEKKRDDIKSKREKLKNPDTDEPFEDKIEEYNKLGIEFKSIAHELNELKSKSLTSEVDLEILNKTFKKTYLSDVKKHSDIIDQLRSFQEEANDIKERHISGLEERTQQNDNEIQEFKDKVSSIIALLIDYDKKVVDIDCKINAIEYERQQNELLEDIQFICDELNVQYEEDNINMRMILNLIDSKLEESVEENRKEQAHIEFRLSMYKTIAEKMKSECIEGEKDKYTAEIFNNANIYGVTLTADNKFKGEHLGEGNLVDNEQIDLKKIGVDTVIIDEVSKSTFSDLLVPMSYAKKIMLVGDHRQLPPIYELRHLTRDDFAEESITEDYNYDINQEISKNVEESFFKKLYEKSLAANKIMLNAQYRSHSHIMDIFNHFYGGSDKGLKIGKHDQDQLKQHGLTIEIDGKKIIEPNKHIYFIDCDEYELNTGDSTSISNRQEANVAAKLINLINNECGKQTQKQLSAGIICTYSDQVSMVRKMVNRSKKLNLKKHFPHLNKVQDEPFVLNTVDTFQGDERDIIIVSMVRNPENPRGTARFIKQFERINVAYSRARALLVIVGSKSFLTKQKIDLPDMDGNHDLDKKNFSVYAEIVDTISKKGHILTASDILN